MPSTLPELLHQNFSLYGSKPALSFIGQTAITYRQMQSRMIELQKKMQSWGICQGDRIAILSQNMPEWGIAYLAITGMGAVAVPLLPDFSEIEIKNILEHSESKAIFISRSLRKKITPLEQSSMQIISIELFEVEGSNPQNILGEPKQPYAPREEELAAIIYTSGTTGKSKGVMLSHRNLCFDVIQAATVEKLSSADRFLSILPLSHTYENTIGFLLPLFHGASIHYLDKIPSPSILLRAMQEVKPTVILSVPLVIEKIYRQQVLPRFQKGVMASLYRIRFTQRILHRLAGVKLKKSFGGQLRFLGIGGAKLDRNVELFLRDAAFPYAIGYGLTETAPLVAGSNPRNTRYQAVGPILPGVQVRIHQADPLSGEGEIQIKGANVMMGYYKEPELTKNAFSEDGWFQSGDLGIIDSRGNLAIRGRLKNMILGPGGENIYPEEIESVINNFRYVLESLVLERGGRLIALVHFNLEELKKPLSHQIDLTRDQILLLIQDLSRELHQYTNQQISKFSRIHEIIWQEEPFEKTATQKIKRFLYV